MKVSPIPAIILGLISLSLPACHKSDAAEKSEEEQHKIVVTSPLAKNVTITQPYVCQIHSQCNIEVCPLVGGRLEEIAVKEGQMVKQGDVMFKILPTLYQTKWEAEMAEVRVAEIEYINTERLFNQRPPVVSEQEVALYKAKLAKAQATANRTKAELEFTTVRAPFDGIVDRLQKQLGSTIKEGEILTTLFDNSTMWVYFNVPEVRYLDYKASEGRDIAIGQIELVLANGNTFPQHCKLVTPMGKVNNETGNLPFRADFPNPDGLLRHGQTGTILIHRTLKNAIVLPQRATFEILDKRFVWVVDKGGVVHQREIEVEHEMDDIFVIKKGLSVEDKVVFEGVRQVHDGQKVETEFRKPEEVLADLKHHAE